MKNIIAYQIAVEQAQQMVKHGIITPGELLLIEAVLAGKYGLKNGCVYRENDLLYISSRANMSHYEGAKPYAESNKNK